MRQGATLSIVWNTSWIGRSEELHCNGCNRVSPWLNSGHHINAREQVTNGAVRLRGHDCSNRLEWSRTRHNFP